MSMIMTKEVKKDGKSSYFRSEAFTLLQGVHQFMIEGAASSSQTMVLKVNEQYAGNSTEPKLLDISLSKDGKYVSIPMWYKTKFNFYTSSNVDFNELASLLKTNKVKANLFTNSYIKSENSPTHYLSLSNAVASASNQKNAMSTHSDTDNDNFEFSDENPPF